MVLRPFRLDDDALHPGVRPVIGRSSRCATRASQFFATAPFAVALLLCAPMVAQQAKIDRDIEFVRKMASEMRLISLAQGEIESLEQQYRSADDQDLIAQLKVELSLYAARLGGDRTAQRAAYKRALEESQELINRSSDEKVQSAARRTMAEAAQEFGQFLIEELELAREQSPDQIPELEEEAGNVFRAGITACDEVLASLEPTKDDSDANLFQYCLMWWRKGALLRENARAVKKDRMHLISRSIEELEEMVLTVGEEQALGLRGLFEIALAYEVGGDVDLAIDGYNSTIDAIVMTLDDESIELPAQTGALLFDMMQEVYAYLGGKLFERGETDRLAGLYSDFRKRLEQFGEKGQDPLDVASPRYGHLTFLGECRFLADSGDTQKVQQALDLAQAINNRHPNDLVGIKAKQVLNEILAAQEGLVSGALLFEVAKGEYQNQQYEEAIKGFRRVLAVMTPEEADTLGLVSYEFLGRAYRQTDRWMESAIAMRTGLEKYGKMRDGEEHPDAASIASSLDGTITWLKSLTKNDPILQPLFDSVEPLVLEYSEAGVGKIHWKNGNNAFGEKNYQEAIGSYEQVPIEFVWYELAQARAAKAMLAKGDLDAATAKIASYRSWLETKEAELDPKRNDKADVRKFAVREMDYTEATIAYAQAYGDANLGTTKDPSKYPAAKDKMRAFLSNHADSKDRSVAQAYDALGRMHTDLGELSEAEVAYNQLREIDTTRAARLASVVFEAYLQHEKNLSAELDKAIEEGKDKGVTDPIRNDLKETRTRLCGLGMGYMRDSDQPQLGILVNTMNGFESLGDWTKVDEVAKKALALYGEDTDIQTQQLIDMSVRPKVGQALLEQGKFTEALAMLEAAEKANPNLWELKRLICLAKGGWCYFSDTGRLMSEPALGQYKEAYDKYYSDYRKWALRPEAGLYTYEWYRFHWEAYWWAKKAGESDTKYAGYADTLFRKAYALDKGAGLKKLGAKGQELFDFFSMNQ